MLIIGSNIPQVDVVGAETLLEAGGRTDQVGNYQSRPFVRKLTSSLAVFGFCGGTLPDSGTIIGLGISETTITLDTGSSRSLSGISGWGNNSNSAINTALRYSDTSIVIPKQGAVDGTNTRQLVRLSYSAGSPFTVDASNYIQTVSDKITSMEIASIDSTYGLMAWGTTNFNGTQNYIKIAVATLSSASVGTVYDVNLSSSVGYVRGVMVFDSTYAVVVYSVGSSLYARLVTMSGTTISSVGSGVGPIGNSPSAYVYSIERINSTTAYLYITRGNYPTDEHIRVYPINLSGGAITIGSSFIAVNNTTQMYNPPSNNMTLAPLSIGTVGLYSDPDDSYYPYFLFRIGVEFKNSYKLFSEAALILDAAVLTDRKILMIYAKTRGERVPIYGRIITLK